MPRKPRIESVGYYHIVNRGVEKRDLFLCDKDFLKFLALIEEYEKTYRFAVHSYCLMNNHYHLLIQTFDTNISLIMKQINYNYTIYFNKKYKRTGPLWQGRYKSWYIYDERYLHTLIKYIEQNPIKAGLTRRVGEYKWASSVSDEIPLSHDELLDIEKLHSAKLKKEKDGIKKQKSKTLSNYVQKRNRDKGVLEALEEGYMQSEIARYLKLSDVAVSKIVKNQKAKQKLFRNLKNRGIFWSYSKDLEYKSMDDGSFVEYVLRYGDFEDLKGVFTLYGKRSVKKFWEERVKSDRRFIKTNLLIARVFLKMDVESDYFKGLKSARAEKLKLLAS